MRCQPWSLTSAQKGDEALDSPAGHKVEDPDAGTDHQGAQQNGAGILQHGFLLNSTQAAVLTALEYADKLNKAEEEVATLRGQMKDYLEDSAKAKSERDYYKRELERYKTEAKFKNDQINLFAGVKNENDE